VIAEGQTGWIATLHRARCDPRELQGRGYTPVVDIMDKNFSGHRVAGLVHESKVHAISISRDGNWIATASDDRQVFLWPWNQKGLIDLTCTLVPRNLTSEEWKALKLEAHGLRTTSADVPDAAGSAVYRCRRSVSSRLGL